MDQLKDLPNEIQQFSLLRSAERKVSKILTDRVDRYYNDIYDEKWGNRHPIVGSITENCDSVMINTNDYLALGNNPELRKAQKLGIDVYGNGQMMSALFLGSGNIQSDFEAKLANFMGVEDVITYQSGYCANLGLLQSIVSENTPIYIDMLAHMSIWEGARRSDGKIVPFLHNNMKHLSKKISAHGPGIILVDSVYSVTGDICPLEELTQISNMNDCVLVVDESHSLGLYGPNGEGLVYQLGLTKDVDFITVSLAKGLCGRGGVVTCTSRIKTFLSLTSFPAIFSTALSAYDLAGFIKAIDIIKNSAEERERLFEISSTIKSNLRELGFYISDGDAPIIALQAGTEKNLLVIRDFFNQNNIFGAVFAPPATTSKTSCYRLTLNSNLRNEDIFKIINACLLLKEKYQEQIPALFKEL